jgi:hypothetical protein
VEKRNYKPLSILKKEKQNIIHFKFPLFCLVSEIERLEDEVDPARN